MIQIYKQDSQLLQNNLTIRKSKALDGFTPTENPANHLKIAEASTQASTTTEVILPHVYAAFFIPGTAVENIRSSISELHPGICLHSPLSLSRGSVFLIQLSYLCQDSTHIVCAAMAQVRYHSLKLSPALLENQLPAGSQHPQRNLTCHDVRLPLASPSGSMAGSFLSQGKQPVRARSHFTLLFATCQSMYPSQLNLRIWLLDFFLPFRQRYIRTLLLNTCFLIASYCCWMP